MGGMSFLRYMRIAAKDYVYYKSMQRRECVLPEGVGANRELLRMLRENLLQMSKQVYTWSGDIDMEKINTSKKALGLFACDIIALLLALGIYPDVTCVNQSMKEIDKRLERLGLNGS